MSRIQALLAAGSLTGLVLAALFWWGGDRFGATAEAMTAPVPMPAAVEPAVTPSVTLSETTAPDLQSLLDQNRQLRETVDTLLAREAQYRQQIEAANQQLLAAQPRQTPGAGDGTGKTRKYGGHAWDDDEYGDHHDKGDDYDDKHDDDKHDDDKHDDDKHDDDDDEAHEHDAYEYEDD